MSETRRPTRLLFVTYEGWPTFRADVSTLFGKYLCQMGVCSDLVAERTEADPPAWPGGMALLCPSMASRARHHVIKFLHNVRTLLTTRKEQYTAIQVRDLPVSALIGLLAARWKGLRFFYWMSFPIPESSILRAKARGPQAGFKYWFPLLHGHLGKWLLYHIVLPRADHVFVQTEQMKNEVVATGIQAERMTAVPMGVDLELAQPDKVIPSDDPRLSGRRVLVYLGTLDRARRIDILFEMLTILRKNVSNVLLVLVGDTEDDEYRSWLKNQAQLHNVEDLLIWTGWLPMHEGWRYVRAAEIGLSPIPRSPLLDVGSPTKVLEYLALGIPVVGNDNPDQKQVITESGCGICTPLTARDFAMAVQEILANPDVWATLGNSGRRYVSEHRDYKTIARRLAGLYGHIFDPEVSTPLSEDLA